MKKIGGKNHIAGKKVGGTHTSIIDGVSDILNRFATQKWFVSVRAGQITTGKKVGGGTPFISVKKHIADVGTEGFKNTFILTFKRSGVIQKIYVQVDDLEKNSTQIIAAMKEIVAKEWKGAELIER